jgi:hypothetical protein
LIISEKTMARHVFVDNANIYGGATRAARTLEQGTVWMAIRVDYRNLFNLIEGPEVSTRILAGSVPPGNDLLWQAARDLGYNTDLLRRVETDDGKLVEQAVDEMLHLKMANALLDHDPLQTLVIASGDGRDSQWATSFPGQAARALKKGWDVEVWSWSGQLTGRYNPLCRTYVGRVIVRTLDPYYRSITFVQSGEYNVDGISVGVTGRIASPLQAGNAATRAA